MSINETGAECSECGSYNCGYLCFSCVATILVNAGNTLDMALSILKKHDITLEPFEIDEVKEHLMRSDRNATQLDNPNNPELVHNISPHWQDKPAPPVMVEKIAVNLVKTTRISLERCNGIAQSLYSDIIKPHYEGYKSPEEWQSALAEVSNGLYRVQQDAVTQAKRETAREERERIAKFMEDCLIHAKKAADSLGEDGKNWVSME